MRIEFFLKGGKWELTYGGILPAAEIVLLQVGCQASARQG